MINTINSKSKHLNLKRIQFFFKWFKIPDKLIPINLKWLITIIGYNKFAFNFTNIALAKAVEHNQIVGKQSRKNTDIKDEV